MSISVTWTSKADGQLAQPWLDHPAARSEITAASAALETSLRRRADTLGESRDQGKRIAFEGPVAIYFRVNVDKRTAKVTRIWYTRSDEP